LDHEASPDAVLEVRPVAADGEVIAAADETTVLGIAGVGNAAGFDDVPLRSILTTA
jgi:hypothetical protein